AGPLQKAVLLPDGSFLEPTRGVDAGTPPQTPPAVQTPPTSSAAEPPGPGITVPRPIRTVKAEYTQEALRKKITGTVIVQGGVGVDGALHDGRVLKARDAVYGLDRAALKAASQWRF